MDFQVGDRVEVLVSCSEVERGEICNVQLHNGTLYVVHNNKDVNLPITSACCCQSSWKLISRKGEVMGKYEEIKARIEKVEGWTEEADQLFTEIGVQHDLHFSQDAQSGYGSLRVNVRGEVAEFAKFDYSSQCSKNTAFKQALTWLLDNSLIKKDEIKAGDYVVATNEKWFCGYSEDTPTRLKVGDIFRINRISGGYIIHCDGTASCEISDVRKATPREVEEYLAERYNKTAELEKKCEELKEEIRNLKGRY